MTTRQEQPQPIQGDALQTERRKPYTKPEIIHELVLETRAGSPLGLPDPLDPFHLQPKE